MAVLSETLCCVPVGCSRALKHGPLLGGMKLTLMGNLLPETMCEAKPTACSPMLPSALCRDACSRCRADAAR